MNGATRRAHGAPCFRCRAHTYTKSGECMACRRMRKRVESKDNLIGALPAVEVLPEDYLMVCTQELARRHRIRAETLAKVGVLINTPTVEAA